MTVDSCVLLSVCKVTAIEGGGNSIIALMVQ